MFIMQVLASQLYFLANKNVDFVCSAINLASKLHKSRGICCTAEWPFRLFSVL